MEARASYGPPPKDIANDFYREAVEAANAGRLEGLTDMLLATVNKLATSSGYRVNKDVSTALCTALNEVLLLDVDRFVAQNGADVTEEEKKSKMDIVCGHLFKKGEVVYRCRTCGVDDTCVMCTRCYEATDHTGHYIFFSVSNGNGCCDCGDAEAWKVPINCKFHRGSSRAAGHSADMLSENHVKEGGMMANVEAAPKQAEPVNQTPPTRTLAVSLLNSIISFIEMTLREYVRPPNTAPPTDSVIIKAWEHSKGPFVSILYNDEHHSFKHVIDVLSKPPIAVDDAQRRAECVDTEGRNIITVHRSIERCIQISKALWQIGLKSSVVPAINAFRESLLPHLFEFLKGVCSNNPVYRTIICQSLCSITLDVSGVSGPHRLDFMLLVSGGLWKWVRSSMRDVFFYSLLLDGIEYKKLLGARFVDNYPALVEDFLQNDDEPEYSIMYISLQLFTTPTIALMLVKEHALLSVIMQSLLKHFSVAVFSPADQLTRAVIDVNHKVCSSDRHNNIFHDLRYILNKKPVQQFAPFHMDLLNQYLHLLNLFQGMDTFKRASVSHVEYEGKSWIHAFQMIIQLIRTMSLVSSCFEVKPGATQKEVETITNAISIALKRTRDTIIAHDDHLMFNTNVRTIDLVPKEVVLERNVVVSFDSRSHAYPLLDYPVSKAVISVHNPLHWMFGSLLLVGLQNHPDTFDLATLLPNDSTLDMVHIMFFVQPVLATTVFCSQVTAHLWRRNGLSMNDQVHHYTGVTLRDRTRGMDLLIAQAVACSLNPDHFVKIVVDAFELSRWFASVPFTTFDHNQGLFLAEECLGFFIALVSERWQTSLADTRANIRRHLIHALLSGTITHSELAKVVDHEMADTQEFDDILNEVAEFTFPDTSDHGYYKLRTEYFEHFDPYFFNCRRADREKAEEGYRAYLKTHPNTSPVCLKKLVPLGGAMQRLRLVMHTPSYVAIVAYVIMSFRKSLEQANTSADSYTSQSLLDRAIYMIVLAIQDLETPLASPTFVDFATHARVQLINTIDVSVDPYTTLLSELLALYQARKAQGMRAQLDWIFNELRRLGGDTTREAIDKVRGVTQPVMENKDEEDRRRKLESQRRQAEIMAQMKAQQDSFKVSLGEQYDDDFENEDEDEDIESSSQMWLEEDNEGIQPLVTEACLLCQGTTDLHSDENAVGILCMVQASTILSSAKRDLLNIETVETSQFGTHTRMDGTQYMGLDTEWIAETFDDHGVSQDETPAVGEPSPGVHISTCGHFMHAECYRKFVVQKDDELIKSINRLGQPSALNDIVSLKAYLCPLCRTAFNSLLPIISSELAVRQHGEHKHFDEWLANARLRAVDMVDDMVEPTIHLPEGDMDPDMDVFSGLVGNSGSIKVNYISTSSSPGSSLQQHQQQQQQQHHHHHHDSSRNFSQPRPIPAASASSAASATAASGAASNPSRSMPLYGSPSSSSLLRSPSYDERRELGVFSMSGTRRKINAKSTPSPSQSFSEDMLAHIGSGASNNGGSQPPPPRRSQGSSSVLSFTEALVRSESQPMAFHSAMRQHMLPGAATSPSLSLLSAHLFSVGSSSVPTANARRIPLDEYADAMDTSEPTPLPSPQSERLLEQLVTKIQTICHNDTVIKQHEPANRPKKFLNNHVNLYQFISAYTYTLRATEVSTRGQKNLADRNLLFCEDTPNQTLLLIKILSEGVLGYSLLAGHIHSELLSKFATELMNKILPPKRLPDTKLNENEVALLEDPFSLLVQSIYALPSERFELAHVVRVGYYLEIVRVLLAFLQSGPPRFRTESSMDIDQSSSPEDGVLTELTQLIATHALGHSLMLPTVIAGISKYVRMMLMPYLRSTALLCYTHFDVPIRKRLRTLDAVSSEVDKLLVYLQLPRFNDLLKGNDTVMSDVVISWCLDFKSLSSSKKVLALPHPFPYFMVPLPNLFDVLLRRSTTVTCVHCGSTKYEPILCLLCYEMKNVCLNHMCTQSLAGYKYHAKRFHSGLGCFLYDKHCAIFLTYNNISTFQAAPYLDTHGESDVGLKRGRPLSLKPRKLNELRNLWLNHKLVSHVLRKSEVSSLM